MADLTLDRAVSRPAPPVARRALMPNLFVIGASKSGSSALHAYLRAHPAIAMSREKEPCFFVDPAELGEAWPIMARQPCSHDWEAYLDLWAGGEAMRYRGEGSVYYSQAPHRSGVAARIAAACPEARILYTVREPVARAVGHYWQRFKEFQEVLPMEQAMRQSPLYRDTSDYALQMGEYLQHFDTGQIRVIIAEDLRAARRQTMDGVIGWLGLPRHEFGDAELTERHKSPTTSRRARLPLVDRMRNSALWAGARQRLPSGVVGALRRAAVVEFDKAQVDEAPARAYLAEYLAPRRAAFEAMIGRRIAAWDQPASGA